MPPPPSSPRPVAIVTGAASGLGRAIARRLAAQGVHVVLADIDSARGAAVEAELAASPGGARFARMDVTSWDDVESLVADTFEREGRLDWMINNAGVGIIGEARDMELRHWRRILDVNVLGVVHGIQAAYPRMAAQGFGRIVNMASFAGLVPTPTGVAYGASKHAVVALSLALRAEAKALGVTVTVACPSFVKTGFGDAAEYLRCRRDILFPAGVEDPAAQSALAAKIVRAAERGRGIVVSPAWMLPLWWSYRLAPWAWHAAVAPLVMSRFRKQRS